MKKNNAPRPLTAKKSTGLKGEVRVPGDKSISHRALIFGSLATGKTTINGLLEAEDVLNTARALRSMGAHIEKKGEIWEILGRGTGGLRQPKDCLDFGNSGTGARLMMGVVAGHDVTACFLGDTSLSRRPMGRVLKPLEQMGLTNLEKKETLPLTLRGTSNLVPIDYELPVPSAQIKSAILIAGLMTSGETSVIEKQATRDHTERMLTYFGADVISEIKKNRIKRITVTGDAELQGKNVIVPGDPSSAAFLIAASLITDGSDVTVKGVLINETRIGFYKTLLEMGANLTFLNERNQGGELVADIRAKTSELVGVHVPPERAPSMIDEYPVLAVVASLAKGTTRMDGLEELKVKESDRLASTANGLIQNGVEVSLGSESLIVHGNKKVAGGGNVITNLDHRIGMAFLTLGLAADKPVKVDDTSMISTSFPEFQSLMENLGAEYL
ncbi:MAG: 3-phosphoshikimate 1-carboxyvinyltransferase [Hyphomicrobium sp.]